MATVVTIWTMKHDYGQIRMKKKKKESIYSVALETLVTKSVAIFLACTHIVHGRVLKWNVDT